MRTPSFLAVLAPRPGRTLGCAAAFALAAVVVSSVVPSSIGQEKAKGAPLTPMALFAQMKGHIEEGKYDLAALFLQKFVESERTDQDLLDIEARYGTTVFRSLRNVPKWSDDPTLDKKARENAETVITQATKATLAVLQNPGRVNKYIRNLGETYEERVFAEMELKRTGDYAVPYMVEALRANLSPAITVGILGSLQKLEAQSMAGWLAALDGLDPATQMSVLGGITSRPDSMILLNAAQTDFIPYLWRLVAMPDTPPTLQKFAADTLAKLVPNASKIQPEAALVALARTFADRKARFLNAKTNPDGTPNTVPVWVWDAKEQKLAKMDEIPVGQADEYYGLRYARWALDRRPDYEPAQVLVLTLAAERAVVRSNFADVAKTDPAVYKLLADAPLAVLAELLDRSLFEKRTALVLALTQALGDRSEKVPATAPGPDRPSLFERSLNYPDARVQLAAANGLLRSPVPVNPKLRGRVLEVLRRAAAVDAGVPGTIKGQALLADPNRQRADNVAIFLRALGYDVEIFSNGRDLLRRVARASDFDLILIDHHIPNPELVDLVGHLRADVNAARRPVLVIASADHPRPPSLDMLLLQLAVLIAATESEHIGMPPPYVPDLVKPPEEQAKDRVSVQRLRDGVFRSASRDRLARLLRVVDTTGLELTPAQKFMLTLRAEQLTFAVLAAESPLTQDSAPETFDYVRKLNKQIVAQPPTPAYIRQVGVEQLMKIIERFNVDVRKVDKVQARYDLLRSHVDAGDLGLNIDSHRDTAAEARVARLMRNQPAVAVIPEPYSRVGLEADIKAAFADPADAPRDPAEKKASAKLAVDWLRRMAIGEVAGFDVKPAEPELLAALRVDDLADSAIDALARLPSAEAQQGLILFCSGSSRPLPPLPLRIKAADAAIRHIQTHGKLTPANVAMPVVTLSGTEANAEMRSKYLVLKGLLAPDPKAYVNDLRNYDPPLVPVPKAGGKGDDANPKK